MPKRIVQEGTSLSRSTHAIATSTPALDLCPRRVKISIRNTTTITSRRCFWGRIFERKLQSGYGQGQNLATGIGLNLLRGAFGFPEWKDPSAASNRAYYSPLVLLANDDVATEDCSRSAVHRRRSRGEAEINLVLREKLRREFDMRTASFRRRPS